MIIFQPARGLLQRCQVLNEIWLELPAWIQLYNFVPRSLVSAWIWNVTDSDHNIGRIRQPQREGGSSHSPWQSLREGFFHKKFLGTTHFLVRSIPWEKWGLKSCKNQNFIFSTKSTESITVLIFPWIVEFRSLCKENWKNISSFSTVCIIIIVLNFTTINGFRKSSNWFSWKIEKELRNIEKAKIQFPFSLVNKQSVSICF